MTHIEQMIQDMCPNGVAWKTLGEVATLSRGKVYSKEYLRDNAGEYPVYSSQTANNGELGRICTYDYDGKYLTWTTDGAYAGTVFRREGRFSITNVCGLISNVDKALSIDFLYYWLNKVAKGYVYQGMGNPKLMSNVMETIEIPLPPLEIQKKIVECLDKFSALAAELQAELQMRRKQYEYYRTQLLTPHSDCNSADNTDDCNWEWKTLVDIATVQYGYAFEADKFTDDASYIPLIRIRDVVPAKASTYYEGDYPNEYIVKKGDILVGMDGNFNLEKWNDRDGLLNQRVCKIYSIDDKIVLNDYLYHYLRPEFKSIENEIKGGTVKHLSAARIKKIVIPIPSIKEQKRIAQTLNLFTKIIQDMEDGIPAEQAAQQKRYEYYRDLLLTFDRKAV